jgi:hypothetical protein
MVMVKKTVHVKSRKGVEAVKEQALLSEMFGDQLLIHYRSKLR